MSAPQGRYESDADYRARLDGAKKTPTLAEDLAAVAKITETPEGIVPVDVRLTPTAKPKAPRKSKKGKA